jgi:hypothetical protein
MNALLLAAALGAGEVAEIDLTGDWKGTWRSASSAPLPLDISAARDDGTPFPRVMSQKIPVMVDGGAVEPQWYTQACNLVMEGRSQVRVTISDPTRRYLGICKVEQGQLYICFSRKPGKRPTSFKPGKDEELWVLKRREPAKPER